jgi:hypothetical protein
MIKRADASKISREKATKEQIAENFKRLAIDTDKKVQLKPSLLKIQKTLDGKTFGIIHENKTYYLKYTSKNGSTNPVDYKHLDGLNSNFGIEKHNNYEKAVNKMNFICEAQNNIHKLKLLTEKEENIIDDSNTEDEKTSDNNSKESKTVTSDSTEDTLLKNLDKDKQAPAPDMGGDMGAAPEMGGDIGAAPEMGGDMGAAPAPEGGEEAPMDTQPKGESPKSMADDILKGIGDTEEPAAPEGGEEAPAEEPAAPEGGEEAPAEEPAAPEGEETDPKKEFQEAVGKLGQVINELQDNDQFDEKDIKNAMNSLISAIGPEGFKLVGDKVVESFYKKMQGSKENISKEKEETPTEEPATPEDGEEAAIEEPSTEKLDETFVRNLKVKAKVILKEQLEQEILKRKRKFLIEGIKRKLN